MKKFNETAVISVALVAALAGACLLLYYSRDVITFLFAGLGLITISITLIAVIDDLKNKRHE